MAAAVVAPLFECSRAQIKYPVPFAPPPQERITRSAPISSITAAPLFSLADAGPARADPYHARGRHEFMHRYLEDQGCAGFDDDFDGWVALYFRSIKRVSKKGQTLDLVPNNKPSMAWRSPVIGSG